jgi:pentatricopeptide repeat protein
VHQVEEHGMQACSPGDGTNSDHHEKLAVDMNAVISDLKAKKELLSQTIDRAQPRVAYTSTNLQELDRVTSVPQQHLHRLKEQLPHDPNWNQAILPRDYDNIKVELRAAIKVARQLPYAGCDSIILSRSKNHDEAKMDGIDVYGEKRSDLPALDEFWTINIALLEAQYNLAYPSSKRKANLHIDELAADRVAKLLMAPLKDRFHETRQGDEFDGMRAINVDVVNLMRQTWTTPGLFGDAFNAPQSATEMPPAKLMIWCNTMLWVLHRYPAWAIHVLLATYSPPYPPFYMVADVLQNLAGFYLQKSERHSIALDAREYHQTVYHLLDRCADAKPYLTQKTIFLYLTRASLEQSHQFYNTLINKNVTMSEDSFLHFAYFFGMHGDFERALDALFESVRAGVDVTSWKFLSTFNKILRWCVTNPEGYHSMSYIVSSLLEMGGQMNARLYHVLMVNAVEANDMKMALRVFNLLEENNVKPDRFTYQILLRGCRDNHDYDLAEDIVRRADELMESDPNPHLATNILFAVYLRHPRHKQSPRALFHTTITAYAKYFTPDMLVELGVVSLRDVRLFWGPTSSNFLGVQRQARKLTEPTTPALNIVLAAYLLANPSTPKIDAMFQTFVGWLNTTENTDKRKKRRQQFINMAMTEHTYNFFLLAYSKHAENLQKCTSVVHTMSLGLPQGLLGRDPITNEPIKPATPTVRTFSILLSAFARHGQTAAAEKVMQVMRTRGLEPNEVTWATLVRGYAKNQDIRGMAKTLAGLQKRGFEGWEGRDDIISAFGVVRDREGLMKAWEEGNLEGAEKEAAGYVTAVKKQSRHSMFFDDEDVKQKFTEGYTYNSVPPKQVADSGGNDGGRDEKDDGGSGKLDDDEDEDEDFGEEFPHMV